MTFLFAPKEKRVIFCIESQQDIPSSAEGYEKWHSTAITPQVYV